MYRLHLGLQMRSDLNTIPTLQGIDNLYVLETKLGFVLFSFFGFLFFMFNGYRFSITSSVVKTFKLSFLNLHFFFYRQSSRYIYVFMSQPTCLQQHLLLSIHPRLRFLSQWLPLRLAKDEQRHVVSLFFICLDLGFLLPLYITRETPDKALK